MKNSFWFMNHLIDPPVSLILNSPLHGMLSASILLFMYLGRKSGREYRLPVQYVQDGDTIYIIPGAPEQKTWWRNLSGGAPVRVILRGQAHDGQAELVRGSKDENAVANVLGLYIRRFPAAAQLHKVKISPNGTCDPADLSQAARSIILVRVKLDDANRLKKES
jgi:deazaflavin-dependent oxidoreductase (nitroreductase family)